MIGPVECQGTGRSKPPAMPSQATCTYRSPSSSTPIRRSAPRPPSSWHWRPVRCPASPPPCTSGWSSRTSGGPGQPDPGDCATCLRTPERNHWHLGAGPVVGSRPPTPRPHRSWPRLAVAPPPTNSTPSSQTLAPAGTASCSSRCPGSRGLTAATGCTAASKTCSRRISPDADRNGRRFRVTPDLRRRATKARCASMA